MVVVVLALASFAGRQLRADTERLIGAQQLSMPVLSADQIEESIADRLGALSTIASQMGAEILSDGRRNGLAAGAEPCGPLWEGGRAGLIARREIS